ncbi:MAG: hypothetical protein BAA01_06150 [Bacillus thermozeamaize]|uniref:Mutator family transposase n=1 Tax=Bacillus thermozeamaize TaxID=230954 RepID=A0A1Y3PBK5_9BACI|nr:MAG: hypothetical protein BAA01_06150 [Bacillus thermozeamaize]
MPAEQANKLICRVLKIREEGQVRSRSALIGIGVNTDGYREALGLMIGDSESEVSWSEFLAG